MAIERLPSTGDRPQHSRTPNGLPAGMHGGGAADSAGFPWAGRTFAHHDTAFKDDDGNTPAAYRDARQRRADAARRLQHPEGLTEPGAADRVLRELAEAHAAVLQALATSRVLVPLVAEAGELGETPDGRLVEKTQELSIVTVAAPDGRTAMPVFTSVDTMRAWDATARPIPVPGPQAALAAAQEHTDLIIVDPADSQFEFGIRRTELEAVAVGEARLPAWAQPEVLAAFQEAIADLADISAVHAIPGDPAASLRTPEVDLVLEVAPGLGPDPLNAALQAVRQNLGADPRVATAVDSLRLRPVASGAADTST